MAITLLGTGCHRLYQSCSKKQDQREPASAFLGKCKLLTGLDIFLGVSAVVLGVLALVGVLPIPSNMVDTFGYSAIAVGSLNLILGSILAYKGCKAAPEKHFESDDDFNTNYPNIVTHEDIDPNAYGED